MTADTPALRTALLHKQAQWQNLFVPQVIARLDGPEGSRSLKANALVSCALSCLDVAATEWIRAEGNVSLGAMLDAAIEAVRR